MAMNTGRPEAIRPRKRSLKAPGPITLSPTGPPSPRPSPKREGEQGRGSERGTRYREYSFHFIRELGLLQHRVAALPVAHPDLHGAHRHQREAEHHHAVDDAHGQVDDRHARGADPADHQPREPDAIAEESDAQHVHRDRHGAPRPAREDRKSTRLNSSHGYISYAVFCLKKK